MPADVPNMDRVVGATGGKQATVGRKRQAENRIVLGNQRRLQRPQGPGVPQPDRPPTTGRGDLEAIGTEGDGIHGSGFAY